MDLHEAEGLENLAMELAWCFCEDGEYEKGLVLYRSLPWETHGEAKCNGMARALTELGRYDEAGRILEKGLKRFPDSFQLWVGMGNLCGSLGDHHNSLRCFETALRFAPDGMWEALYNKAVALEKLGSYRKAAPILDDLIDRHPEEPNIHAERGGCALEMGYPQEAVQYYQRAMRMWGQAPSVSTGVRIYLGLCAAYTGAGQKKEAAEIALEGLKRFPDEDPALYQNVVATFLEMGWTLEAREVLRKGVEKFPEDEELKSVLESIDDSLDDPDGGVKPPLLGLILLSALIHKSVRERRKF